MKKVVKIKASDINKIVKRIISEQSDYSVAMDVDELDYETFQTDENLDILRKAIDNNKTVSVAFVKKDGTVRHMAVRKSLSAYVGSDKEKSDAQLNVEKNHNIKRVVDINAYIKTLKETGDNALAAKSSWRSINLKDVLGFMASGQFIDLRGENDILGRFGEEVNNSLTKNMLKAVQNNAENAAPEEMGDQNEVPQEVEEQNNFDNEINLYGDDDAGDENISEDKVYETLTKLKESFNQVMGAINAYKEIDGSIMDNLRQHNNYGGVDKHVALTIRSLYDYLGKLDMISPKIIMSSISSIDSFLNDMEYEKNRLNETNLYGYGSIKESTAEKLIKTAEKDGHLKGMQVSANYVVDAAKKIGKEWDMLDFEEKKVFRDEYYKKFLKAIKR